MIERGAAHAKDAAHQLNDKRPNRHVSEQVFMICINHLTLTLSPMPQYVRPQLRQRSILLLQTQGGQEVYFTRDTALFR